MCVCVCSLICSTVKQIECRNRPIFAALIISMRSGASPYRASFRTKFGVGSRAAVTQTQRRLKSLQRSEQNVDLPRFAQVVF